MNLGDKETIISDRFGEIDITSVMDIIQTPQFQRLRRLKQLGFSHLIFPGAQHTRLEHCLGSFQKAIERTERWYNKGLISKNDARNIQIFALIHDLGHGPGGHTIEPILSINHEENGIIIFQEIKQQIEKCGADFEKILQFQREEDPLYLTVKCKNLGVEKFDYLQRDSAYTAFGSRADEMRRLNRHTYFLKNKLTIKRRAIGDAEQIQKFYLIAYKNIYLNPGALRIQSLMQKMIMRLMQNGITEKQLWRMTDDNLLEFLAASDDSLIKFLWSKFELRIFPKVSISFRLNGFGEDEIYDESDQNIKIFEISNEEMKALSKITPKNNLRKLEEKISQISGVPIESVLVVHITTPERFLPEDIQVIDANNQFTSLFKIRKKLYPHLKEEADSYMAFRICVFKEYHEKILTKAEEIKECTFDFAKHL